MGCINAKWPSLILFCRSSNRAQHCVLLSLRLLSGRGCLRNDPLSMCDTRIGGELSTKLLREQMISAPGIASAICRVVSDRKDFLLKNHAIFGQRPHMVPTFAPADTVTAICCPQMAGDPEVAVH